MRIHPAVAFGSLFAASFCPISTQGSSTIPNIVVIIIDDLGWNQVGYHANPVGNDEIQTPFIDYYSTHGIEMDRGYMTPWCAPSRATIQTGRTNSFNANITNDVFSFDEDIGFIGGLQAGTQTIAKAFKEYAADKGYEAKAYYNGKWGIGGTSWANTPMGLGYDTVRGFWGDSIDGCDGHVPYDSVPPAYVEDAEFVGQWLVNVLPGFFDQNPLYPDNNICPYIKSLPDELLSEEEKYVACKTHKRTPPKLIDEDVLDLVVDQIHNHDYEAGPMLQFFATQMMHMPIQYPKRYDTTNNDTGTVPSYFGDGEVKPTAGNDDVRIATANAVRFVDDLVGETMQAIQDAGQWENTIVLVTSDNGGAIYMGSVNNNYPLRSAKLSKFEGGVRVPQFMSGGWIDKQLAPHRNYISDTYFFPMDISPTLLQMAGAEKDYLLDGKTGAVYGHRMWNYIRNSVQINWPNSYQPVHQKERNVSYAYDFYFEVTEETTFKHFWTGDNPQLMPRLWRAKWPEEDDLTMDLSYVSIFPCRPKGKERKCCSFDIESDITESYPINVNCQELRTTAQELFTIEGGCLPENEEQTNYMCIPPNTDYFPVEHDQNAYKLWSVYGAGGPFANGTATPINVSIPMKCICESIDPNTLPGEVDHYIVNTFSPNVCFSEEKRLGTPARSVECGGGFTWDPQGGELSSYAAQGLNEVLFAEQSLRESNNELREYLYLIAQNLEIYNSRQGYTEWPGSGKYPFIAFGLDSCVSKQVTPVPFPQLNIGPYSFGVRDPTVPSQKTPEGLCAAFSDTIFFCPAKQNANLTGIESWNFDSNDPSGLLLDGRNMSSLTLEECAVWCARDGMGSAYIGEGPFGIAVDPRGAFQQAGYISTAANETGAPSNSPTPNI